MLLSSADFSWCLFLDEALTTCLNVARKAVSNSGDEQRLIKTFPRKGVRFVATVRVSPGPTAATCPTGSLPRTATSLSTCAPTGQRRMSLTAAGCLPRSKRPAFSSGMCPMGYE